MPFKLLLADDSLTIQKVVELVLAPENFEIRAFNDGEQAWQAIASFMPDIVLADIEMPKLNGYQLCDKIKNDMATANIPVILLAGAFEPFDEEYAKSVYADDFIIKPFESQELISKVKALMASAVKPTDTVSEKDELIASLTEDVSSSSEDEPSWEDAFQQQANKSEEQPIVDNEYDALLGGKGFNEELADAIGKDEPLVQEGGGEDPFGSLMEEASPVTEMLSDGPEYSNVSGDSLSFAVKDSAEKIMSEVAPEIIEKVTRELVKGFLGSLRGEIDTAIRKIVPEVAEAIIKKEIEKITSETR